MNEKMKKFQYEFVSLAISVIMFKLIYYSLLLFKNEIKILLQKLGLIDNVGMFLILIVIVFIQLFSCILIVFLLISVRKLKYRILSHNKLSLLIFTLLFLFFLYIYISLLLNINLPYFLDYLWVLLG